MNTWSSSKQAQALRQAVKEVIEEGKYVTYDLKTDRDDPTAVSTMEMAKIIASRIKSI